MFCHDGLFFAESGILTGDLMVLYKRVDGLHCSS